MNVLIFHQVFGSSNGVKRMTSLEKVMVITLLLDQFIAVVER